MERRGSRLHGISRELMRLSEVTSTILGSLGRQESYRDYKVRNARGGTRAYRGYGTGSR